jgi:hypothetical protein
MPGCKVGIITAPTTDGATITETLPAGFQLKALMLAASYNTADGHVAGHARFSFGIASLDGGSIQQGGQLIHQDDGTASSQTANGVFTTATLRQNLNGTTTTSEMEVDVTDMQSEQFTLTFTTAPASAIKLIYMAFQVAKARVVPKTHTTTSPETIEAPAGWGQPDLVLGTHGGAQLNGFSDSSLTNAHMPLGVAVSDTVRQCSLFAMRDAQTASNSARWQKQRFMLGSSNNAMTYEADLDIQANWPADGIQIVKPDLNPNGMGGVYLFIQDPDLQVAMGVGTIRTTVGDTDHAAGFAPAGALVFGSNIAASTTLGAADADGYEFQIGMTDGVTDCMVGILDDDAALDMNTHTLFHSTKGLRYYTPVTPTLVSEADLSFSGNNLRVSTTDADTVAREYVWVVIGPPPAAPVVNPPRPTIVADAVMRSYTR